MDGKVYCKHCGELIDEQCVVCPKCGKQVSELTSENPNIVINNSASANASSSSTSLGSPKPKNKWVAFFLCLFLGPVGAHKFYEGKILLGIVYILTAGLFLVGWVIDCIKLLFKPNPYYV